MKLRALASFFFTLHIGITCPHAAPLIRSAVGDSPAAIQAVVDQFRADISLGGSVNAPGTGPFATGRREINWDGVPDNLADTNKLPADFFNNNSKRGVVLHTPGTGFLVSARQAPNILILGTNLIIGTNIIIGTTNSGVIVLTNGVFNPSTTPLAPGESLAAETANTITLNTSSQNVGTITIGGGGVITIGGGGSSITNIGGGGGIIFGGGLFPLNFPPVRFGGINSNYVNNFRTFSPERLFAPLGSTITDVDFFVPGNPTEPGTVIGFGAVFTDVEIAGVTTIEFFNVANQSLGVFAAPVSGNAGLSFLGVSFPDGQRVARVRITSGNAPLGAGVNDGPGIDVVAMDDFIFSEPLGDLDGDGVLDLFDQCPNTAAGSIVDSHGCSLAQLVPCEGPRSGGTWRNHGEFVSAMAHAVQDFIAAGLLTQQQAERIVSAAAQTSCGKPSRGGNP